VGPILLQVTLGDSATRCQFVENEDMEGLEHQVVLESLVAHGAPLGGFAPRPTPLPFEQTVVAALDVAHLNSTVLRVLPALLSSHAQTVQLDVLKSWAVRLNKEAELGFLLELTDQLFDTPRLTLLLKDLSHAKHPHQPVLFFRSEQGSERARKLAEARSPEAARHWGFLLNMPESGFKSA
jgi:hypothetical protein